MTDPHSPYTSPNPHRLYRDPDAGMLFGVCAGLADFLGIKVGLVRLATVAGVVFFAVMPVVLAYGLAAMVLKPRPRHLYRSRDEEEFWRSVSMKPDRTLAGLRQKFRDMERRLGSLETHVTSREFELNRALRDLER